MRYMGRILSPAVIVLSILLAACAPQQTPAAAPSPIPTVKAPAVVVAEGRVEPIRFARLALNSSGLVSEVLQKEGDFKNAIKAFELAKALGFQEPKLDIWIRNLEGGEKS